MILVNLFTEKVIPDWVTDLFIGKEGGEIEGRRRDLLLNVFFLYIYFLLFIYLFIIIIIILFYLSRLLQSSSICDSDYSFVLVLPNSNMLRLVYLKIFLGSLILIVLCLGYSVYFFPVGQH